jgi:hypothetical protein
MKRFIPSFAALSAVLCIAGAGFAADIGLVRDTAVVESLLSFEPASVAPPNPPAPLVSIPSKQDVLAQLRKMTRINDFGVALWREKAGAVPEGLVFIGASLEGNADYRFLSQLGVKTVLSLQALHHEDEILCSANGMDCVQYDVLASPIGSFSRNPMFRRALGRLVKDTTAGTKVYIHCLLGLHRTGALMSALTIRNTACGKRFNKAALRKEIEDALMCDYGYAKIFFRIVLVKWHLEVLSWVDNFEENQWLCE